MFEVDWVRFEFRKIFISFILHKNMKFIRALWTGALVWFFMFLTNIFLHFIFKLISRGASARLEERYSSIIIYVSFLVFLIIFSIIYFKGEVKKGIWQGLLLGIIYDIIGVIFLFILIILYQTTEGIDSFFPRFYLTLIITSLVGIIKNKSR